MKPATIGPTAPDPARLWRAQRRLLRQTRRHPDGANVHDLRTGTRRLLAHLELLRSLAPSRERTRARHRLKQLLAVTGPARDARVQLALLRRLAPETTEAGYARFERRLRQRRQRLTEDLPGKLERHQSRLDRFSSQHLFPAPAASSAPSTRARQGVLLRAARRVLARQPAARTGDAGDRHRLRVALKQFRYLVETRPVPGAKLARFHLALKRLGDLHDLELLLERLEKFSGRHPATGRWLRRSRRKFEQERRARLRGLASLRCTATQLRALFLRS